MVCFEVKVVVPKSGRVMNNEVIQRKIGHLARHCNADYKKTQETENNYYYTIRLCDEDAVTLLRDLPTPFHVERISILRTNEILYIYRRHISPPHYYLLKEIYWLAKSTERWTL